MVGRPLVAVKSKSVLVYFATLTSISVSTRMFMHMVIQTTFCFESLSTSVALKGCLGMNQGCVLSDFLLCGKSLPAGVTDFLLFYAMIAAPVNHLL